MRNRQKTSTAFALAFAGIFAGTLRAAGTEMPENPATDAAESVAEVYTPARAALTYRRHLITPLSVRYAQSLPTSLSTHGKMAYSVYGAEASWRFVQPEKTRLSLSGIEWRRTEFRFSDGAEKPFAHTDLLRATTYQEFINPTSGRALVALLSGSLSAEDRADVSSSPSCLVGLAAKQYFSEETSATLGFFLSYRRDRERWFVYPLFLCDWRIAPNLNLRAANGLTLTWDVGGDNIFLCDFAVGYETDSFAVEAERDAASPYFGRKGVYTSQSVPVSVTGTWNVSENFFVRAGVALNAWSKYRLYRSKRKTDETFSTDPTLEFSFECGFRF